MPAPQVAVVGVDGRSSSNISSRYGQHTAEAADANDDEEEEEEDYGENDRLYNSNKNSSTGNKNSSNNNRNSRTNNTSSSGGGGGGLSQLLSMGFSESESRSALDDMDGDVEAAIMLLTSK